MRKRLFFVALMVAVFTLAMVGSAFAAQGNSGYTTWSEASTATGAGTSPHANYATTTKNCGVCHAVHHANAAGQLLLNDTVANACNYCHVGGGGGYTQVYYSQTSNYTPDTGIVGIENHSSLAGCTTCHAVHGANTAWHGEFILKLGTYAGAGQLNPSTQATSTPMGITAWCTGCHGYYNAGHGGTTHIMTTATANFAGPGNTLPANSTVAWGNSTTCMGCHDATPANGFPHYTPNAPRFMTHGIVNNNANPTAVNNDGACIWCHVNGGLGVGKTF